MAMRFSASHAYYMVSRIDKRNLYAARLYSADPPIRARRHGDDLKLDARRWLFVRVNALNWRRKIKHE